MLETLTETPNGLREPEHILAHPPQPPALHLPTVSIPWSGGGGTARMEGSLRSGVSVCPGERMPRSESGCVLASAYRQSKEVRGHKTPTPGDLRDTQGPAGSAECARRISTKDSEMSHT